MKRSVFLIMFLSFLFMSILLSINLVSSQVTCPANSCCLGNCCVAGDCDIVNVNGVVHQAIDCAGESFGCGLCQGESCPPPDGICVYPQSMCEACCEGPGCSGCAPPSCGNGIHDSNEQCDDGNNLNGDGCDWQCAFEVCGNGRIQRWLGEQCDDVNLNNGDGCSSTCRIEQTQGETCSADDIILRLSSETNAHGEIFNGAGNYPVEICYSEIFGEFYSGTNPHVCTPTNKILGLFSETNAHAERKERNNYPVNVCYGDLVCASISGDRECSELGSNAKEVVSLSWFANAHIETASSNSYNQETNVKVCCGIGSLNNGIIYSEWTDLQNNRITESSVNRTVKMTSQTTGFPENSPVEFYVWEEDGLIDDEIGSFNAVLNQQGFVSYELFLSDEIISRANGGFDCSTGGGLEFFFETRVEGRVLESSRLLVGCDEDGNEPPVAVISGPIHRQMYFANFPIHFDASHSFDPDGGALNYLWNVKYLGQNEFSDNRKNFTHIFPIDKPGMRTITLRVTDTSGLWREKQIAILVLASPGMLAYIEEPFHMQVIENTNNLRKADYSAKDSYVVNSVSSGNACNPQITCLAGNCPDRTYSPPPSCVNNISLSGELNKGFGELYFNWTFRDSGQEIKFEGFNKVEGSVFYSSASNARNDKTAELILKYDNQMSLIENTNRIYTLGQCIAGGTKFIEVDSEGNYLNEHGTVSSAWCSGGDNIVGNGNDCCPSGSVCSLTGGNIGCVIGEITKCLDYSNAGDCEADIYNIAQRDPAGNNLTCQPGQRRTLECYWETKGTGVIEDDYCGIKLTCDGDNGQRNDPPCRHYSCNYGYEQSECVNGWMTIDYVLNSFDPGTCDPDIDESVCRRDSVRIPCGRFSFELGFFEYQQVIISIISIAFIYALVGYFRKR